MDHIRAEVRLIHPEARMPYKGRSTDVGWDVHSVEDVVISPGTTETIHTGICVSVPPGYFYTIEGRSGLFFKDIIPANGIIDATYTGEILIRVMNAGDETYTVKTGDRVAQLIFQKVLNTTFEIVDVFSPEYDVRGTAGFGSSGK